MCAPVPWTPNAAKVIERAMGKPIPEVKFFHMAWTEIAGKKVRALRHGMAGQPGLELFGPWDDGEAVRLALVEDALGLQQQRNLSSRSRFRKLSISGVR